MNRLTWCLGILSLLAAGQSAPGAEFCIGSLGRELKCTRCAAVPCCCPDDYCRKPPPCIPCPPLPTACDTYCRKPIPCIQALCLPNCPDDYCRKPLPQLCWPANPYCHCGPSCDGGAGCSQKMWTRVFLRH